jgi:hypothetical protein
MADGGSIPPEINTLDPDSAPASGEKTKATGEIRTLFTKNPEFTPNTASDFISNLLEVTGYDRSNNSEHTGGTTKTAIVNLPDGRILRISEEYRNGGGSTQKIIIENQGSSETLTVYSLANQGTERSASITPLGSTVAGTYDQYGRFTPLPIPELGEPTFPNNSNPTPSELKTACQNVWNFFPSQKEPPPGEAMRPDQI